ncbi:hypothetical protein GCM10022243_30230 [Saccharothrix violaceirubra]|uniref:Lantibiotic dehydratase N-terminal domain-containing protein n=1 Tax=Saccharothrix violaceirubra TaxID=413306 RepID=A0A7W7WX33_9PSEU|nr:lantibiotic dehydratase [Saccharothrix violaceirubra]MBB4966647.1 hypothetical protein [Saccharothrix violaceirubra]
MYRTEPLVVIRFAGLPATLPVALRATSTVACVDSYLDVLETGRALAAELHDVIGRSAGTDRARLVALRRALHGGRAPGRRAWPAPVDDDLAARIHAWCAHDLPGLRAGIAATLAGDLVSETAVLRTALTDEVFRHSLRQASPVLADEADKWLADPGRTPRRRTLIGLARYVLRAATKTSPFSGFATIRLAGWRPDGPLLTVPDVPSRFVQEVDAGLVRSISTALHRRVRLNPSVTVASGHLLHAASGPVATLPATPAVQAVLALLTPDSPELERADVVAWLAGRAQVDVARADLFVTGLERAGVVEVVAAVPEQAVRPFAELAGRGGPAGLSQVQRHVDRASPDTADVLREVCADVGVPVPDRAAIRRHGVHETRVSAGEPAWCGHAAWRSALDDLDTVRVLLGLYDPALPYRLALGTEVGRLFGPGARVPLLVVRKALDTSGPPLAEVFHPDFLSRADPLRGHDDPRLARLRELRAETTRRLVDGSVDVGADWPDWVQPPPAMTAYIQRTATGVVLNAAHGGTRGRTRWERLARQAGASIPTDDTRTEVDGTPECTRGTTAHAEVVETAVFGGTLDLRSPAPGREIVFPGATGTAPPAARIPVGALEVRHDPERDLVDLVERGTDRPLRPEYTGMTSDALLPPLAQLVVCGFGRTYLTHPTLPAVDPPPPPGPGVVALPRVDVGSVTLARARWLAPPDSPGPRPPGTTDAERFVALRAWRRAHGVPARCFVRRAALGGSRAEIAFDKSHKPLYVDFDSAISMSVLDHFLAAGEGPVEFVAMWPEVSGAEPGGFVAEYVVEIGDH